jgi:hypothetical protein
MPRKYGKGGNVRRIGFVILILALVFAVGCGGSSSSSSTTTPTTTTIPSTPGGTTPAASANNVAPLIVDAGPPGLTINGQPYIDANIAFVTVTICAPGSTTNCQTINHVAVDTGSTGLRIPYGVLNSSLQTALLNVNGSGSPLAECIQFLDESFFWGSVRYADVKMGGTGGNGTGSGVEVASSIPIHVMGDPAMESSIPTTCSMVPTGTGSTTQGTEEDTVNALGANGLIGVGNYQYDCDFVGVSNVCICPSNSQSESCTVSTFTLPPGTYYTCTGGSCTATNLAVPVAQQLRNPVSGFATDNNGVILELPAVTTGAGGVNVAGSMVFGIGTQTNNGLSSSAVVLALDSNFNDPAWGGFTTTYNGVAYPNQTEDNTLLNSSHDTVGTIGSFLDSGSNYMSFLDYPTTRITDCSGSNDVWYCPSSTESLTAYNQATGSSVSSEIPFSVTSANTLFSVNSGNNTAFSDLAGPNTPGTSLPALTLAADGYFDWGLPFFYGRNVYTAIQGVTPPSTPASGVAVPAGPWWAY